MDSFREGDEVGRGALGLLPVRAVPGAVVCHELGSGDGRQDASWSARGQMSSWSPHRIRGTTTPSLERTLFPIPLHVGRPLRGDPIDGTGASDNHFKP